LGRRDGRFDSFILDMGKFNKIERQLLRNIGDAKKGSEIEKAMKDFSNYQEIKDDPKMKKNKN
jgi:hypothetical protein